MIKDVLVRFSLSRGHPHDVRTLLIKSPKTKFGFDTAQAYTLMCKKVFTSAGKRLHTQSLTHYRLKLRIFDEKVGRGGGGGGEGLHQMGEGRRENKKSQNDLFPFCPGHESCIDNKQFACIAFSAESLFPFCSGAGAVWKSAWRKLDWKELIDEATASR